MEVASKINGAAPMDDQIIERVIAAGDLKLLKADERNQLLPGHLQVARPESAYTAAGIYHAQRQAGALCPEGLHGAAAQAAWRFDHEDRDRTSAMASSKSWRMRRRRIVRMWTSAPSRIKGLAGDALVNAKLKAITKAKRRVTLSICGLGFLDETEIETIPTAAPHSQPAQIEAGEPEGLITRAQRKDMNDWIGKLKVQVRSDQ